MRRFVAASSLLVLIVAGCRGGAGSPSPQPSGSGPRATGGSASIPASAPPPASPTGAAVTAATASAARSSPSPAPTEVPVKALLPRMLDGRETRIADLRGPQIGGMLAAFPVLATLARARHLDPAAAETAIAQPQIYASRAFVIVAMRFPGETRSLEAALDAAAASNPGSPSDRFRVIGGRRAVVLRTSAGVTYALAVGGVVFLVRSLYLDLITDALSRLP